jgi:hypothetical protein
MNKIKKSKKKLLLLLLAKKKDTIRTRNYVTNDCICNPNESAWIQLYRNGIDENFINLTSLDRASFNQLLKKFAKYYKIKSGVGKKGRPRKLVMLHQVLGLILQFYSASIECKNLCQIFGIAPATLCRTLKKAETALLQTLLNESTASVRWPTLDEQRDWANLISQ